MTQDQPEAPQRLLALPTAARLLGMTERALRARVTRKQIPIVRIGRRVFVDARRLDDWIAQNSEDGGSHARIARFSTA